MRKFDATAELLVGLKIFFTGAAGRRVLCHD